MLEVAVAVGVPALIAYFTPRRWRLPAFGLWIISPALVFLALGAREMATGKASPADLDKLIFGLLLIGSFVVLPWLIACGVGFAVGAVLRGRAEPKVAAARPERAAPPAPEPAKPLAKAPPPPTTVAYSPPLQTEGPTLTPGGWQAVHVGFDHDDLEMDGLRVWSLNWQEEPGVRVMLAHPAHPTQQHEFRVYNIDDGGRATRFAAAELSNGVWGFYRWVVPADAPSGESADGSVRWEHDLGALVGGRYDSTAPVARLYDARSGAMLFDGAAWSSSRIVPQHDGALLLELVHSALQSIFRIDPPAGAFRNLSTPEGPRPLAELADAAARARAECDDPANAYLTRRIAPDGSLKVVLQAVEWSNTHWVNSPCVTEIATGRVLLDLWGTDWDAWPTFPRPGTVHLSLRRYHYGGGVEVEIELAPEERYIVFERAGVSIGPLAEIRQALEQASQRAAAAAPPRVIAPPRTTARSWLVALLILVGALAAIAVATLVTPKLQGPPARQKLDTIPAMPGPPPPRLDPAGAKFDTGRPPAQGRGDG